MGPIIDNSVITKNHDRLTLIKTPYTGHDYKPVPIKTAVF